MAEQARVRIVPLERTELKQAAALIAETMSSNPILLAIFPNRDDEAIRKQQAMFEKALAVKHNRLYAAKVGDKLAGIMCYVDSEHCQLSPLQLITMLPSMWGTLGSALPKVLQWRHHWGTHDHKAPHVHFGPLAVHTGCQGQGIGSALLRFFCDEMDRNGQVAFLETDKDVNLPLYQRFGFRVIEEDDILGVNTWFMVRDGSFTPE